MHVLRVAASSLLASLCVAPSLVAGQQVNREWILGGTPDAGYVITAAEGSAAGHRGATIGLRGDSVAASAWGTISATLPADSFRLRRIRLVADIETKNVRNGASTWFRVDGPGGSILAFDNGSDEPVTGTGSGHRDFTFYVPARATTIRFGLLLLGRGEATMRGLRIETRPAVPANTPLGPAARRELDSAIALARARSLWRDTVTWTAVEADVRAAASGAESAADVHLAIQSLLQRLGDHHSFLMRPAAALRFRSGGAENPRPVIRALPDGVGYISVPAYSGAAHDAHVAYARGAQDSLAALLPLTGCGWVVDLRGNGGGNMWPMLGGLRPFLGDVAIGSFTPPTGSALVWHAGDTVDVRPTTALAALDSAWVAVLTGPHTASSGEIVAISFRGRSRTRSFGLPTAGLTTDNELFPLPDGSLLVLTVAVDADRTGRRYGGKFEPDELVQPAPTGSPADPQLARALAWLRSRPGCR